MAKEVIMPKFGFTQEESEILEWLKKEGETVEKGDPIATVSTDKLSMEVEAPESGILSGIRYKAGDIVPVTNIIAFILQPGEKLPEVKDFVEPTVVAEKTLTSAEPLMTGNATPVALRMMQDAGIAADSIQGSGTDGKITKTDVEEYLAQQKAGKATGKVAATPAARRVAVESNTELASIPGSGPKGRIQETDVRKAVSGMQPVSMRTSTEVTRISLKGMRRIIAENMARSWHEAPHMTLQVDVDMSAARTLRELSARKVDGAVQKFTYTALLTKVVAWALVRHPKLNSRLEENEIVLLPYVHMGVAVAVSEGLIVPVIKNADQKSIYQISDELKNTAERARTNKLVPDDLEGGTFTISNLGMYGVDRFTAIINPPQSAILAVGNIVDRFVPDENKNPVLKPIMTITASADHRVVDGAEVAEFLADVKKALESPGVMFL
ncbi:MAG: dihydrolipoamide acetyltransferase family protein [Anaerolineaceae bacterium]